MNRHSDEELLEVVNELANSFGRPPTLQEIEDETKHSRKVYFDRFGSWQAALEAAGFEPRPPQGTVPDDELISELQRLREELGHMPSATEMNEQGEYWVSTYRNHFGSWTAAIEAAGMEPPTAGKKISHEKLVAELKRLSNEMGERPTIEDMNENGEYNASTYIRAFDSWANALDAAGIEKPGVTRDGLVADLQELAEELDKQPSQRDMNEHGEHSHTTYVRMFGSWTDALDAAFEDT